MRTAVPPRKSGSVELIVGLLAEGLSSRGHEVTVFAPQDSSVHTRIMSILPTGYHHDSTIWDWELAEFMQLGLAYEHAEEFDVLNSHAYCYALPFTRLVDTPTVHTFHICPTPDFVRFCRMYPEGNYILISEFQRQFFADVPISGIIHNGIDTSTFSFNPERGKYLAYLGDIRPDKDPLEAIRFARAARIPIKIAGHITDQKYFQEVIKSELDGHNVEYVGEVDHAGKASLLSGALALLFFSQGLEACPLVLLESMACGTPILAIGKGPIPEIVEQGVGGIYATDSKELLGQVNRIYQVNRASVRKFAIDHYDVSRMVDDYLKIFSQIVDGK
jgi:glycosyltransferase involved in cell wall biosynthesis